MLPDVTTTFTRPRHLSLSWAKSIQSTPLPPNVLISYYFLPIYAKVFHVASFAQVSHQNSAHTSPPYLAYAPHISFFLIWSAK